MLKEAIIVISFFLLLPTAVLADKECPSLLERGWRGIDCLHCLHQRAPENTDPIVTLLKATCLKNVIISFVIDGSFGWKEGEIEKAVSELRSAGRNVWLHLYVYNGPAQRRWRYKVFNSFAVMDPLIFRRKIISDAGLKVTFTNIVKTRVLPVASFATSLGAQVSVAPGLEDSLDDAGFRKSVRLVKSAMGKNVPYTLVRSSCFRCGQGVGRYRPKNALLEEHDDRLFANRWDGIINTDGRYFRFSHEKSEFPTLQQLTNTWLLTAERQRNKFLLWVPHFQDAPPGLIPRPLYERNFRGPTEKESEEIIKFLTASS